MLRKLAISMMIILISASAAGKSSLRVAAIQYPIKGDLSYDNFAKKFRRYLEKAKAQQAELVIFPEYITLDQWPLKSTEAEKVIVTKIADESSQKFIEDVKKWAVEFGLVIVAGTVPRKVSSGKYRNSAIIAQPGGKVDFQDKIFFTPWDSEVGFEEGADIVQVKLDSLEVSLVVLICFDVEFPRISTLLAKIKPEIIFVPSMTETVAGFNRVRYTAQARAVENHSYVVVTGAVGKTSPTWENFGQAAFLSPQETGFPPILTQGKFNNEDLVVYDLDLRKLRESRKNSGFNPAKKDQGKKISITP